MERSDEDIAQGFLNLHKAYIGAEECKDQAVEANRQLLKQRSEAGVKKYGVTLDDANLSESELLKHALEEALDLSNYLQSLLMAKAKQSYKDDADKRDAEIYLRKTLAIVQQYLLPDGKMPADMAISKIIEIVDPWPLYSNPPQKDEIPWSEPEIKIPEDEHKMVKQCFDNAADLRGWNKDDIGLFDVFYCGFKLACSMKHIRANNERRKEFEKFYKSFGQDSNFQVHANGQYVTHWVEMMWKCWKAARKVA